MEQEEEDILLLRMIEGVVREKKESTWDAGFVLLLHHRRQHHSGIPRLPFIELCDYMYMYLLFLPLSCLALCVPHLRKSHGVDGDLLQ
jgi:hypothetical protein